MYSATEDHSINRYRTLFEKVKVLLYTSPRNGTWNLLLAVVSGATITN